MSTEPQPLSGLTVDGVPVPLAVEADGPHAIVAHLASLPGAPRPAVIEPVETAPNPPAADEGDEA